VNITNKEYSIKKDAPFARYNHKLVAIPKLNGILSIGGTYKPTPYIPFFLSNATYFDLTFG
jgi:hypothetical protein